MAQTGLAPEKSKGTDGAGLRNQGTALLGEVELVPSAGKAGSVCLGWTHCHSSCPLGVAGEDGVGCQGLWYFLVMGALMPCTPLAKAPWHGSWPTRVGLEKQLPFWQMLFYNPNTPASMAKAGLPRRPLFTASRPSGVGSGSEKGWQEVPKSSQAGRGGNVLQHLQPKGPKVPIQGSGLLTGTDP